MRIRAQSQFHALAGPIAEKGESGAPDQARPAAKRPGVGSSLCQDTFERIDKASSLRHGLDPQLSASGLGGLSSCPGNAHVVPEERKEKKPEGDNQPNETRSEDESQSRPPQYRKPHPEDKETGNDFDPIEMNSIRNMKA